MKRSIIVLMIAVSTAGFAADVKWTVTPGAQNPSACFDLIMPTPRVNTWISAYLVCSEIRGDTMIELFRSNHLTLHVKDTDAMQLHVDPWQGVGSISNGRGRMTFILPKEVVPPVRQKDTFSGNRVSEWSGNKYIVYRIGERVFYFVVENKNNPDGGPVEAALYNPPIERPTQEKELPTKPSTATE
jgi:hypothetical protein